jgi:hypothetical protein
MLTRPAAETIDASRRSGRPLSICAAIDQLDWSISRKEMNRLVRREWIKGLCFAGAVMALAFIIGLTAHAQSFHQITLAWSNSNSTANGWPPCAFATSPKTTCVQGFTVEDLTSTSTPVVLAPSCTATVTASCLSPSSTSFVISPLPTPGSHIYAVIVNGIGPTGSADNSAPATIVVGVTTQTPPNPTPTVSATFQ